MVQGVQKHHVKFRREGITQKKQYILTTTFCVLWLHDQSFMYLHVLFVELYNHLISIMK